jgi:hypothetical protein
MRARFGELGFDQSCSNRALVSRVGTYFERILTLLERKGCFKSLFAHYGGYELCPLEGSSCTHKENGGEGAVGELLGALLSQEDIHQVQFIRVGTLLPILRPMGLDQLLRNLEHLRLQLPCLGLVTLKISLTN